ncbi:Hypothetical predicted protein [Podarcis lilfordi]|uniref:Uncharacterized protein n=1 Tax=Podarcis lilfordi TaxID=74358 RepID=A0AA35K7B3_9SAUR|nr:Hypothetical predicted protein [Podarcis lilfordi]
MGLNGSVGKEIRGFWRQKGSWGGGKRENRIALKRHKCVWTGGIFKHENENGMRHQDED